jgi:hypothetical protein
LPLILSATTLLGAWGTFNSNYKEWFAKPNAYIYSLDQANTLQIVVGKQTHIKFGLKNANDWTKARATITEIAVSNTNHIPTTEIQRGELQVSEFSVLPGEIKDFQIPLIAAKKGNYILAFHTRVTAGEFLPARVETNEFPISVWQPKEFKSLRYIQSNRRQCTLELMLSLGVDYDDGLGCELTLTNAPRVVFKAVPSVTEWDAKNIPMPGKEVSMLSWQTQALKAFSQDISPIILESESDKDENDWKGIIDHIHFAFR